MSISTVNCQLSMLFHGCMQPSSPYHTSHLGDKVFPQPSSKVYTTSALERTFCRRGEKRRIFPCFNGRCRVTSRLQRQISATFKHQLRRLRECSLQLRPSSKTYLNSQPRCPPLPPKTAFTVQLPTCFLWFNLVSQKQRQNISDCEVCVCGTSEQIRCKTSF